MDGKDQVQKKKNPREGANPLSALTFAWILKTFWVGYKRELEIEDLTQPLKEHTSGTLGHRITTAWDAELDRVRAINEKRAKKKGIADNAGDGKKEGFKEVRPSLLRVLTKIFGPRIMLYGVALAIMEIVLRLFQPLFLGLLIRCYRPQKFRYTPLHVPPSIGVPELPRKEDAETSVLQPLFLGGLLQFYSGENTSPQDAYFYAGGIIACSAINIFVIHPYMMAILHMGMKMRVACCSLIYRKSLKLSKTALGSTTIGQAVNLLSNDVTRFDVAIIFLHYLWIGPLETIVVTYFMCQQVGIAAVIGVASLLMFIPLQGFLGKRSSVLRLRTAIRTDERVRLTNEIITGIQAIKMYTWEHPFSDLIEKARWREIKVIRSTSYIRGIIMSFIIFTTRLSLFITVLAYVLAGEHITAEKVFILIAYYNILRQTMTVFFPQGITQVAEAAVSIKRLQDFMMYEEVDEIHENAKTDNNVDEKPGKGKKTEKNAKEKPVTGSRRTGTGGDGSVILDRCHAKWLAGDSDDRDDTLRGINFKVEPGQLVAVVGQVGSGKSSLLNVILKELQVHAGTVEVNGHIAYASQEPWLFAGSVRQNILFGRKMEHNRYEQVIKVCQLKRDFSLLPYGDKTIVGERGISLSGGQRARINLARAVYANAPICLFDDPLSAVDAHVGKHMFEECIAKYLKGKTRILVTHQLQFLRNVDRIYVLKDGAIQAQGTYNQLSAMGVDFGRLLEAQPKAEENSGSLPPSRSNSRHPSITSMSSFMTNTTGGHPGDEPDEIAEMRSKGSIGGHVYAGYLKAAGSWCLVVVLVLLAVGTQLAASGGDYFIAMWVNIEERASENMTLAAGDEPVEPYERILDTDTCIYIYTALTVLTILLTLLRSYSFFEMCMRASMRLHDRMFRSISRATMRFFNTNTSGRVLNRFSKDMGAIDELLPIAMIDCIQIGLALLGIVVVVGTANPILLVPTVIIGFIFYFLRVIFLATSRSVKRLEGITRSPVFGHLNATLQGLATIRSFDAAEVLTSEFDHHQDLHSSAWYLFIASSRAFGFWLDIFCLIYITLVTLSFLVLGDNDDPSSTPGGSVGLAITQSIGLTGMFQWGMRQSAELENQMTSVERVLEYSNVESEPPLESSIDKKPPENWPNEGKVEFKQVYMRYSPLDPPVLKNLNFVIKPREKVGIVGRTGAGKSSLISAIFRLADVDGSIVIDGIEANEIGLHDLRSKISIIPQEPFLFSGTLRTNLDPFGAYGDNPLWEALEEVELKEMGLEARINEGGGNLSVGQRQLVCLARAIVRNNPILVLDEATANVDPRTDELIQKTIRRKFENRTVLTIAHRLNTVMDSDRILVMDAGTAVEFDHPHVLLQNKESGFLYNMVAETGKSMTEALTAIAKENYALRQSSTTL